MLGRECAGGVLWLGQLENVRRQVLSGEWRNGAGRNELVQRRSPKTQKTILCEEGKKKVVGDG